MKYWNLIASIASALGSFGTFFTFCCLAKDRHKEKEKLKESKLSAMKKLQIFLEKVEKILEEVKNREKFNEVQVDSISNPKSLLREILDKLTIILGIKIIDDDIHSALFLSRNKILEINNSINNNILTECQSKKLEKILSELSEEINIEINRLE